MKQAFKLIFNIQVIDQDLFTTVSGVIDQEGDDRLGDGIVDVLFDYVEVGCNESLYHFCFCLFSLLWVLVHLDD